MNAKGIDVFRWFRHRRWEIYPSGERVNLENLPMFFCLDWFSFGNSGRGNAAMAKTVAWRGLKQVITDFY
jgi:hypothetical protein